MVRSDEADRGSVGCVINDGELDSGRVWGSKRREKICSVRATSEKSWVDVGSLSRGSENASRWVDVEKISSHHWTVVRVLGGRKGRGEKLGLGVKIREIIVLDPREFSEVRGV